MDSKRERFVSKHLDPASRLGEVLFGLIMVLSVTLIVGLNEAEGDAGIHELLFAALGCNIAWGVIDAVMFVMSRVVDRGERTRIILQIREASDGQAALDIVRKTVEPELAPLAGPEDRETLYRAILKHLAGSEAPRPRVEKEDLLGALASFWLVFVTCFPAVLPFLFLSDPRYALHVSNLLLLTMLFAVGVMWGGYVRTNRLASGATMLAIGLALVGVAIMLGG